ncbi:glycerol-3-phosphate 1-O-acyltransferase PlsY [Bacillus sp. REN3]|uniref:glycerol-3-phosphate 1-O-acyltransferase PlsY n=1 Tax=Bacillus sp. REN3 TaxID=2802440 RepID=UPI001AEEADE7|nr:glycerol-3-phosphate 1-O-acyltransferase PlsY [Bacillus sp. REN3]
MTWIIVLAAYLIGSIPTALLIGKCFFNVDIRDHGSKNPGATNTFRVLGKRAAVTVLLVDVAKGMLAASLPLLFNLSIDPLYTGLIAVVGHCFPVFAGLRGGKAIATTAGTLLVADLEMFFIAYLAFFLVTFATKYVFFGSISVGLALFAHSLISADYSHGFLFLGFTFLLVFLHRSNIRNFLSGTEKKINDRKRDDRIPPRNQDLVP